MRDGWWWGIGGVVGCGCGGNGGGRGVGDGSLVVWGGEWESCWGGCEGLECWWWWGKGVGVSG